MTFEQNSTNVVAAAIVSADLTLFVTAKVGHIPSTIRYVGFSGRMPLKNRSIAVGCFDMAAALVESVSFPEELILNTDEKRLLSFLLE